MRPVSGPDGESSHLAPCPECGAANGFNALECWKCESALPVAALEPVDRRPAPGVAPNGAALVTDAPVDPPAHRTTAPEPLLRRTASEPDSAIRQPPERHSHSAAAELPIDLLGDAGIRTMQRRRRVAAGASMVAIAAAAIGYAAFQDPVRIALSPAELSHALRADAAGSPVPPGESLLAIQEPVARRGSVHVTGPSIPASLTAPPVATRAAPRPTVRAAVPAGGREVTRRGSKAPAGARNRNAVPSTNGVRGRSVASATTSTRGPGAASSTAARNRSAKATTRHAAQSRAGKPARIASTQQAEPRFETLPTSGAP